MAHLWSQSGGQWAVQPLGGEAVALGPPSPTVAAEETKRPMILRQTEGDKEVWILLVPAETAVRVNGVPVAIGIRVVRDRDEIRVPGEPRAFFSAETPAEVVPFPEAKRGLNCQRCMQVIEPGTPAVKCPGCGAWHHQNQKLNCWTYNEVCANGEHPTDLEAGFCWTPEEL